MNPVLDIFLPVEASLPVHWRRYQSASATMHSCGDWATSERVKTGVKTWQQRQQKADVRVFIPGEWVIVRYIDLPDGTVRHADRVVPTLLEEELCEDIDTLHFSILSVEQNRVAVAVIRHQKMQRLSDWLQETGLFPRIVLPDWMAFTSGQGIVHGNRCLMRTGQWQGWSAEVSMVASIIQADEQVCGEHLQLYLSEPSPPELTQLFSYRYESVQVRQYSEALREKQSVGSLLCGRWRPRTNYWYYWRRWRFLVWVAVLVMCLLPLQRRVTLLTLESQAAAWQARIDRVAEKEAGAPVSDQLRARFNDFLQSLSRPLPEDELLIILPQVARVLASREQTVSFSGLTFEQNEQRLSVALQARNMADLDTVRTALSAEFEVEEGGVQEEGQGISTLLTLKQKSDQGG